MPHYKLHYFEIRSRGEPIRLMFTYRGVPFEDHKIRVNEWPSKKSSYPNGILPLLEVDGVQVNQSMAIYRYLSKQLDLNGKTDLEAAQIDSSAELFRDFVESIKEYFQNALKESPAKERLRKEQFLPAIATYLPQLEEIIRSSGSGFFAKSGLTWVDFYVSESIRTIKGIEGEALKSYPLILNHNSKFYEMPELKAYLDKRGPVPY
ncbi:Glutathione S-transferase-1 [Aphelenchoides besseyi]|nr:Glutathione S-transferase-1 [Aphelenchoides besseyi]KAI6236053.1 Glutathione S-transferase-1 [Aphelenchoides besseyi]